MSPNEKVQLTSVFRFFPIRVSSIAAISLDAMVGSPDEDFLSKASGSLMATCQTIAFMISENITSFQMPSMNIFTKGMKFDPNNWVLSGIFNIRQRGNSSKPN